MEQMEEIKNGFKQAAAPLGDYSLITKADLASGYLAAKEADDDILINAYYAAIMLRYWFKIYKYAQDSKSMHMELPDFVEWLDDAIRYALDHHSWTNPENKLYGDLDAFDKVVNQCVESVRLTRYQQNNKHKRKANALVYSLDAGKDDVGDYALEAAGAVEEPKHYSGAKSLICEFLNKDRTIEALILDAIAYQDTSKEIKEKEIVTRYDEETGEEYEDEIITTHSQFDQRKLVQHLTHIDNKFMQDYFSIEYDVNPVESNNILTKLRGMKNPDLYKCIKKTLLQVGSNKTYMEMLLEK